MSTRDNLIAARALIAAPEAWARGTFALDAEGLEVFANAPEACAWCAEGAIARVLDLQGSSAYRRPEVQHLEDIVGDVPLFNDTHTHAEVLAAFDAAIAAVR